VAVAPEPVKQDLFDNEIVESVPKTMKAKVQLMLKKMKRSPDISWNEKEELKYKGETVQESNVVDEKYRNVLEMFMDKKNAYYSIHQIGNKN
jgi:hypothetical protein